MDYCVYTHKRKDNGKIVYVGSGTTKRPKQKTSRNSLWHALNETVGLDIEVIKYYSSRLEAQQEEQALIRELDPQLNLQRSVAIPRDLTSIGIDKLFRYDHSSPSSLRWITETRCDEVAGSETSNGWVVHIKRTAYMAHRVVVALHNIDLSSGDCVDHIDGNKLNNIIDNLRVVSFATNMQNRKNKRSNTGVIGVIKVSMYNGNRTKLNSYFKARWRSSDDLEQNKHFSISKHGEAEAFRLACEYRKKMITELNAQGAGYTERHGT